MAEVVLMDGGMGQELVRRSPDAPDRAWGARVMLDYPEMVVDLHKDFIAAGAEVITINAYAATRRRLADIGREDLFETLQRRACELAARARDESGTDVVIAGSISPMEFSYRPDIVRADDEVAARCAEIARLQAPHVDVMICETMSVAAEARASSEGASAAGRPVWVGITVDDEDGAKARGGEPLAAFVDAVPAGQVSAWFANCSRPEAVGTAITAFAALDIAFGGYANGFETLVLPTDNTTNASRLTARQDLDPPAYAAHALDWVETGAAMVGGCCEVGPAHIAGVASALRDAGHTLIKPVL